MMPMKIEVLREKENKPLARREIDFRVDHVGDSTPSRADIKSKIVAQFDADPLAVAIETLTTKFGVGITEGTARIYLDPEQMKRIELDYMIKRNEAKKEEGK